MVSFRRSGGDVLDAETQHEVGTRRAPSIPDAAAFPRVNLMPEVIAAEARIRRSKLVLVGAGVAAVVVVGGLYVLATNDVSSAQGRLDTATVASTQLKGELAKYAAVPQVQAQVAQTEAQLYQAMGGEVRWSFLLNDLSLRMPNGIALKQFTGTINGLPPVSAADASAAAAATTRGGQDTAVTSVLGQAGIGTINYKGEMLTYPAMSNFLDMLAKQKTLFDPYPVSASRIDAESGEFKGLEWEANATVSSNALSHRYDPKAGS